MHKASANSHGRARVSKDEDEPLRSPSCIETHRIRSSSWTHASLRCDAPQHEGDRHL
jgi:hypothetical protein